MRKVRGARTARRAQAGEPPDVIDAQEAAEALIALAAAGTFAARVSRSETDPEVVRSALALVLSAERFASALHERGRRQADR